MMRLWRFSLPELLFEGIRRSRTPSMFERSELRRCRKEWWRNGV